MRVGRWYLKRSSFMQVLFPIWVLVGISRNKCQNTRVSPHIQQLHPKLKSKRVSSRVLPLVILGDRDLMVCIWTVLRMWSSCFSWKILYNGPLWIFLHSVLRVSPLFLGCLVFVDLFYAEFLNASRSLFSEPSNFL